MKSILMSAAGKGKALLPGPQVLVAGTMAAGFFGEVTAAELVTEAELNAAVGLGQLGDVLVASPTWLKFAYKNKILYIAKKPLRRGISWAQYNLAGIMFGKTVNLKGFPFSVRHPLGGNANPATAAGGEWNALMYPICTTRPNGGAVWANYSEADLVVSGTGGVGSATFCQELFSGASPFHVYRGYNSLQYFFHDVAASDYNNYGWRPVLEYVGN